MAAKLTPELIESIVTKVTDKFAETMSVMMKEFTKCFSENFSNKVAAMEMRLAAIEGKLSSVDRSDVAPVQTSSTIAETISKTMVEIEHQREEKKKRSLNVIVSGLPAQEGVNDKNLFEKFCEDNLTVKPRVMRTSRPMRPADSNVPPKLIVTLQSAEDAHDVISSSSILRHSSEFSRVFINRDLTREEASAAYESRCRKRNSKRTQSTTTSATSGGSTPAPPRQPFPC